MSSDTQMAQHQAKTWLADRTACFIAQTLSTQLQKQNEVYIITILSPYRSSWWTSAGYW